jgi:isocitrate dehydrogenase kinase/phosphatase
MSVESSFLKLQPEQQSRRSVGGSSDLAIVIGNQILDEFDRFYGEFKKITQSAKTAFEQRDYSGVLTASRNRLSMYSISMDQLSRRITDEFRSLSREELLWEGVESHYGMLTEKRYEADLALAYMHSVRRAIFRSEWKPVNYSLGERKYFRNTFVATVIEEFKTTEITTQTVLDIFSVPKLSTPFSNAVFDATMVSIRINQELNKKMMGQVVERVEVLKGGFFRNRGAYIVGRIALSNETVMPLVIALLNSDSGIYVDAVINAVPDTHNLFSSTLANFHVSNTCYHEICEFLSSIMPQRPLGLIYSTIGFNHFGKVAVMDELTAELNADKSVFDTAIGFQGTVAIGFQSLNSSYSLKVIRNQPTEQYKWGKFDGIDSVLSKYSRVHQINRTGSMLDNIIYYNVKLHRDWFNSLLVQELLKNASQSVVLCDDSILFKHLIVQRRVTPLPVYLTTANQAEKEKVIVNLGHCIKNNTAANIFNKDLDARNYGVSQYQKVYLFDYDALEPFTDVKIRTNQERIEGEEEVPEWFFEDGAVFLPEEIESGLRIEDRELRRIFQNVHGDLMRVEYWEKIQEQLRQEKVPPVRVYPEENKLKREQQASGLLSGNGAA